MSAMTSMPKAETRLVSLPPEKAGEDNQSDKPLVSLVVSAYNVAALRRARYSYVLLDNQHRLGTHQDGPQLLTSSVSLSFFAGEQQPSPCA
jgi:hypothetical protein